MTPPIAAPGDAVFVQLVRTLVLSRNRLLAAWTAPPSTALPVWEPMLLRHHVQIVTYLCTCCADKATDDRWMERGRQAMAPLEAWLAHADAGRQPRRALRRLAQVEDTLVLPMATILMTAEEWSALASRVATLAAWLDQAGPSHD